MILAIYITWSFVLGTAILYTTSVTTADIKPCVTAFITIYLRVNYTESYQLMRGLKI